MLDHGEFCPSCGSRQPTLARSGDPLIGQLIAERYQIEELISTGGMGRVYRAVQRPLDRTVAVKVIDPGALDSFGPELASRFLAEARAASTLNHPNVVSIFDFGRASHDASAPLFLVMEFLVGPTLGDVLDRHPDIPFDRVANILCQALAALGEAHDHGIAHRDVKPSNIVLEPQRGSGDRVKVIDFGLARIGAERRLTEEGRLLGTPHYMAPELGRAGGGGPSADLYAVGVVLFELLTGAVPFDDTSFASLLALHASAPRPDPRKRAPHRRIPAALAELCMRSIDVDPAKRPPDATTFARELVAAAAASPWGPRHASLFPSAPRSPRPASAPKPAEPRAPTMAIETSDSLARMRMAARASSPSLQGMPLVARDAQLATTRETLERPSGVAALAFSGTAGTGKTRMLAEAAEVAAQVGALVLDVPQHAPTRYEIAGTCLRALLGQLTGTADDDELLRVAAAWSPPLQSALGDLFDAPEIPQRSERASSAGVARPPRERRSGLVDVVRHAAGLAIARARGALVVPLIDDLDTVDSLSRAVLVDFVEQGGLAGVLLVATSDARAEVLPAALTRYVRVLGLTRSETRALAGTRPSVASEVDPTARRVEPLYMEHYLRWRATTPGERAPPTLVELLEAYVHGLVPTQRRILQALAVVGEAAPAELQTLVARADGIDDGLRALGEVGFVHVTAERARITHAIVGRIVIDNAPAGVLRELHARAAANACAPRDLELRAYHAIGAHVDLPALQLLHECASWRAARGDVEGAIIALNAAYVAARARMAHGEDDEVAGTTPTFGCLLADAILEAGRADQANGVLSELLGLLGATGRGRPSVLEALARVATARKRYGEAARLRRDAELAAEAEDGPTPSLYPAEPRTAPRLRSTAEALAPAPRPSRIQSNTRTPAKEGDPVRRGGKRR